MHADFCVRMYGATLSSCLYVSQLASQKVKIKPQKILAYQQMSCLSCLNSCITFQITQVRQAEHWCITWGGQQVDDQAILTISTASYWQVGYQGMHACMHAEQQQAGWLSTCPPLLQVHPLACITKSAAKPNTPCIQEECLCVMWYSRS